VYNPVTRAINMTIFQMHVHVPVPKTCVRHAVCAPLACRIRIYGTDFSQDRFTGGNVVYVGPYPCTVVNHRTSTTVVGNQGGELVPAAAAGNRLNPAASPVARAAAAGASQQDLHHVINNDLSHLPPASLPPLVNRSPASQHRPIPVDPTPWRSSWMAVMSPPSAATHTADP
jgi:hypothetical protein